jgi:hypothetical protein
VAIGNSLKTLQRMWCLMQPEASHLSQIQSKAQAKVNTKSNDCSFEQMFAPPLNNGCMACRIAWARAVTRRKAASAHATAQPQYGTYHTVQIAASPQMPLLSSQTRNTYCKACAPYAAQHRNWHNFWDMPRGCSLLRFCASLCPAAVQPMGLVSSRGTHTHTRTVPSTRQQSCTASKPGRHT